MSVDVRGLKITIGGKPIVSDADMTIADGERVGLIGSSGSGKSMIAKAMLGLLPLTAVTNGSIDMGGTEIIGASERALADLRGRYVGAVFQNPGWISIWPANTRTNCPAANSSAWASPRR